MEEQKKKVVEMKPQVQRPEKMSYDQLESVAHQLSEQNRQMFAKLQELNMANMFKRLDYLFKVIENGHMFKQDFLEKCIAEIESLMTVPEQEEEPETVDKA
jgi:ribosome assembly protein YihI (activator of Der GTPase)